MSDENLLKTIKDSDYQFLTTQKDEKGIPYLKHIFRLYQEIYGEVCSSCPSKIAGYIQKLKKIDVMPEEIQSNFKLKKNSFITIAGTNRSYSNANLTDKIAIEILRENPNRIALFAKVPTNLEKLLKGSEKTVKKTKSQDKKPTEVSKDKQEDNSK